MSHTPMDDFLTAWVLHDAKLMTYRLLSREKGIHVQDAKTALQGFYERTVKKKAFSLSALYVVKGVLKEESDGIPSYHPAAPTPGSEDQDVPMREHDDDAGPGPSQSASQPQQLNISQSLSRYAISAPPIAAPELVPRKQLLLVSADKLEEITAKFASITTSHIYSLAPGANPGPAIAEADEQKLTPLAEAALKQIPLLAIVQNELHTKKEYVVAWERAQRGRDLGVIWNSSIVEDFSPTFVPAQPAAPAAPAKAGPSVKKPAAKVPVVKTEKADSKALPNETVNQTTNRKPDPPKPAAPAAIAEAAAVAPVPDRADAGPSKKRKKPVEDPAPPPVKSETKPAKAGYKITNSKYKVTGSSAKRQREEDEEDEDEAPKPPPAPAAQRQQHRADAAAVPEPPKTTVGNRSSSGPAAVPAPPPQKSKPAFGAGGGSGSGFGKSASGSGGGAGAAKKPVDKRQQTLGSFFKKKT